ncbi:MAG: translation elongation factor-like protein [Elusimicrobiota bacterium]
MELKVGVVEDFFTHIPAIAFKVENEIAVGDTLHVKGHTTDFIQQIESMQIEHKGVQKAVKGDSVGMKVNERARKGDTIYKVIP